MADQNLSAPTGIKVLSVIYYIGAALSLLGAIAFFIGAGAFYAIPLIAPIASVIGIALLIGAVLGFFIARGLRKGKNWARIVVIIFACLGVLGALISLFSGSLSSIISLAVNGLIAWYLIFNDEVKMFFAKH